MIRFLIIFGIFFLLKSQAADVNFIAYVENKVITDRDDFHLILEFSWTGNPQQYQVNLPPELGLVGLEMLGSGASNKLLEQDGKKLTKRIVKYRLRALRTGDVEISPIQAQLTHIESGEIQKIESLAIKLKVIKYKEPFKLESKFIWLIIVALLVLIGLVFLIITLSKRKKKKLQEFQEGLVLTVEEEALNQIKKFKNDVNTVNEEFQHFIKLFENYKKDKKVENDGIFFGEESVNFSLSQFKNDLEMYRFSGQSPDIYQFDEFIRQFTTILENNKKYR